jgi:DNA polymerase
MENAQGRPFIGPAGVILNNLLNTIGLKRSEIYITNAVKYYPTTEEGDKRAPSPAELAISRDYLLREISVVNPKIVGLCGYAAIACIFPTIQTVNEVHYELLDERFVPLYHPATIGYRPELKGKVTKGYKMLSEYIKKKANDA